MFKKYSDDWSFIKVSFSMELDVGPVKLKLVSKRLTIPRECPEFDDVNLDL